MKVNDILREFIDTTEEHQWFKDAAKSAFKYTIEYLRRDPDDSFRGYFMDSLRGQMDATLGYVIKQSFGLSHDPAFQTVFFRLEVKDIVRPAGHFQAQTGDRYEIRLSIPKSWVPENYTDFVPTKLKRPECDAMIDKWCHLIANTMAHELTHMHQWLRINTKGLKWTPAADRYLYRMGVDWDIIQSLVPEKKAALYPYAMLGAANRTHYLSKEDETWGLPNERGESGMAADHYDPALKDADYLTRKNEVDAHANNVAMNLLYNAGGDLTKAKAELARKLKDGPQQDDSDAFDKFYQNIRKNKWVDTTQAWRVFLKRVYQRMARIAEKRAAMRESRETQTNAAGDQFTLITNPTASEFKAFVGQCRKRDEEVDIRGLFENETLYLWDGYYAHHHEMARNLGLENPIHISILELMPTVLTVNCYRSRMVIPTPEKLLKALKYFRVDG